MQDNTLNTNLPSNLININLSGFNEVKNEDIAKICDAIKLVWDINPDGNLINLVNTKGIELRKILSVLSNFKDVEDWYLDGLLVY